MTEQRPFWERLMVGGGDRPGTERENMVLEYVVHRLNKGADLQDVLREEYVHRNCSPSEVDAMIAGRPELIHVRLHGHS